MNVQENKKIRIIQDVVIKQATKLKGRYRPTQAIVRVETGRMVRRLLRSGPSRQQTEHYQRTHVYFLTKFYSEKHNYLQDDPHETLLSNEKQKEIHKWLMERAKKLRQQKKSGLRKSRGRGSRKRSNTRRAQQRKVQKPNNKGDNGKFYNNM